MSVKLTDRFALAILALVEEIPEGNVATYGQLARLAGYEKHARLVASILSHSQQYGQYPCHRVVNTSGRIAPNWPEQVWLLQNEGVMLKDDLHVDLKKYQWSY